MEKKVDYNKMKKAELIKELERKERPVVHHNLSNSVITVKADENSDDTATAKSIAKALENLTEYMKNKSMRPVYGVYFAADGMKKGDE